MCQSDISAVGGGGGFVLTIIFSELMQPAAFGRFSKSITLYRYGVQNSSEHFVYFSDAFFIYVHIHSEFFVSFGIFNLIFEDLS
jgi:hypothetical protein